MLELFKVEGKGGIIEIQGEPLFPLKMTLDYLIPTFKDWNIRINTMKAHDAGSKYVTPTKRAFKESKNINNFASRSSAPQAIEVEGKIEGWESDKDFKHQFEISNNLITRLTILD